MIICPDIAFKGASNSIILFLNVVLPSLFPFMVLMELLMQTRFLQFASILFTPFMRPIFNLPGVSSTALIFGFLGGYPNGAIVASNLREKNLISRKQANHLIGFCNNASPIFITGAIGVGLLSSPAYGMLLLKSHLIAGICVGLLMRFLFHNSIDRDELISNPPQILDRSKHQLFSLSDITNAIFKSLRIMSIIGSYIIIFGVIISVIDYSKIFKISTNIVELLFDKSFFGNFAPSVLSGLVELTTGIKMVSSENIPLWLCLSSISMLLGWGSLSVHFQVISLLKKTDIQPVYYIIGKILHGILSAIFTIILIS
jgi:sporulation integral membrane protein YlbJ